MTTIKQIVKSIDYFRPTELCHIMNNSGSDKSNFHTYTRVYSDLFKDLRHNKINILEIGLGTKNPNVKSNMCGFPFSKPGGSLYGWREWFTNANIYGADIDPGVLFQADRIKTFQVDQTDPESIHKMFDEIGEDVKFDIIIDDGLHEESANYTLFKNSFDKVKPGGFYIVEDCLYDQIDKHLKNFESVSDEWLLLPVPGAFHLDNSILIVKKA